MSRAPNPIDLPELPCACANLRRATRAVTQVYDDELRSARLRTTQFTLLQALELRESLTQRRLGELLALDSTTLSRTLRPLASRGLVRCRVGRDRRERLWELTGAGRTRLLRARPLWERAQERLRAQLAREDWETLPRRMARLASAALDA